MIELITYTIAVGIAYVCSIFLFLYVKDLIEYRKWKAYISNRVKLANDRDSNYGKAKDLYSELANITGNIDFTIEIPSFNEEIVVVFPCEYLAEVEAKLINYGFYFDDPNIGEIIKIEAKRSL